MKTLLVFALAFAAASAEEKKEMEKMEELKVLPYATPFPWAHNVLPYAYNQIAYNTPLAYNTYSTPLTYATTQHIAQPVQYIQPVQTKVVPKEFEVEVKTLEFKPFESDCKNVFGLSVPCKKAKRSAEEEMEKKEEEKKVEVLPYTAFPYATPVAANMPVYYNTYPYTTTHAYSHVMPYAATYGHVAPLAYASPVVKTLEPKVQEIEVPTPVFKQVKQEVPLAPMCQNHLGMFVPCKDY